MVNQQINPYESPTFGKSLSLRVDGAIGAMSLSPNGRDAVLAGRRGLFVIDMDDPFTPPRWLHHITSWEVADVQWSPHATVKPSWCVSTSNQKALLWDLNRPSNNAIENILHSHSRAISDINFHPFDPEMLATCSIDTFVLCWDMRTPRKPVAKWADWRAGAIQVKWNHENPYEIASTHDNSLYIWDTRKGALPIFKVAKAHQGKINGLDFSQGLKNIITCSNDRTIKFWDLESEDAKNAIANFDYFDSGSGNDISPSVVVEADFAIARARALPFGSDKACGVMPLRGGNDAIHIINYEEAHQQYLITGETQQYKGSSAYAFVGHHGPFKDFLWRTRHENYNGFDSKNNWKEYQLVTWSNSDVDLKLWPSDEKFYRSVNYDPTFFNVFKNDSESDLSMTGKSEKQVAYNYETYCQEPEVTIDDLAKTNGGDLLSALTSYQISEKHRQLGLEFNQLDHLNWISGVRMGRGDRKDSSIYGDGESPSNLGEEVSIVGHKFPFIRFEKISVSTGDLVISLKGPVPVLTSKPPNHRRSVDSVENSRLALTAANSTKDKSIISEDGRDPEIKSQVEDSLLDTHLEESTDNTPDQKLVFIRLALSFPQSYPYLEQFEFHNSLSKRKVHRLQKQNSIEFNIEETHELHKDMRHEMENHLGEIARFYTNKYQQFCLEPCLRYLMGEKVDLDDEAMAETRGENIDEDTSFLPEVGDEDWVDDLINQQPGFHGYSSGEDAEYDDLIPAASANTSIHRAQSPSNINVESGGIKGQGFDSTPIPKGCGAVWAPNGQLVCFFIPKDKPSVDTGSGTHQNLKLLEHSDLHARSMQNSKILDHLSRELEAADRSDSDSDMSDGGYSETSSSDDYFEEDLEEILKHDTSSRSRVPGLIRSNLGLGSRFISNEGRHKSSLKKFTSHGESLSNYKSSIKDERKKSKPDTNGEVKNVVVIIDFSQLLPNRIDLAREYKLVGDKPEILAGYNSRVAAKYCLDEIAQVWKILEIILSNNIKNNNEFSHISKYVDTASNSKGKSRGVLSIWGTHPFGYTWLIKEIFSYFVERQNTQMLATMSCVLHRTPYTMHHVDPKGECESALESRIDQFSSHQSSHIDSVKHLDHNFEPQRPLHTRTNSRNIDYPHSVSSSFENYSSRADTMDRVGYGRKMGHSFSAFNSKNGSQNSLAEPQLAYRSSTPKSTSYISVGKSRPAKGAIAELKHQPPPTVAIEMQNVEELDLFEDSHSSLLPDFLDEDQMKMYRLQYAETLYEWDLPVHRIEVLKFNYNGTEHDHNYKTHECKVGFRKRRKQLPSQIFINTVTSIETKHPNAWNTNKRSMLKYCIYCGLLVTKNFTLCGNCEHILHTKCAQEWWSGGNKECASGCGCNCLEESIYH
ncbi:Mtc5 protein [Candida orthopsilosis Co 90-125]|uniref:Mtc5 protein n=1 Tax=Candida orthopsilosis (strain 90-125) TaxID=1136231 RepID=H8WVT0_CANO9|nr:Mtc5 protein [Candida orthopsilosis Co 90-125]CCG20553.1 Mtc5 protein [Candida orthopsilosis Co 90-125]